MTVFVVVAALMVAVACAWVLVPLLRGDRRADVDRHASNLAILRDQLRELEGERARGVVGDAQYEQAKGELERRVLEEAQAPAPDPGPAPRAGAWAAALIAAMLPIGAVVLYAGIGNPEAVLTAQQAGGGAEPQQHQVTPQDIEAMVGRLAQRLEKEPDNAEGWMMLGRSYYVMNRFPDAARAYERAIALMPDNADVLADYADALAVGQNRSLAGKPLQLIERALKADPTHWKALALAGTAAFDRRDYAAAVAYWERMKATVPPGSEIARSIDDSIAEARTLAGLGGNAATAAADPAKVATAKSAPSTPAAAGAAQVSGKVSLAPALAAKAAPDDTVYIFARAANGPRMPLAILRKQVRDLPATFALDDTMAMSDAAKLSGFPEVVVGARISKSGNAAPQSGDLEGSSPPVKVGASGVSVVIDSARP
jgi:cytochrome c-type biogenesis protein CcmH